MTDMKRVTVNVPDEVLEDVLQYQQAQRCLTMAETLRSLVKRGLEAWAGKQVQADAPQTNSG